MYAIRSYYVVDLQPVDVGAPADLGLGEVDSILDLGVRRSVELRQLRVIDGAVSAPGDRRDAHPDQFPVLVRNRPLLHLHPLEQVPLEPEGRVRYELEKAGDQSEHLLDP